MTRLRPSVLVVLLAVASLLTTGLIVLNVLRLRSVRASTDSMSYRPDHRNRNLLFEQGIELPPFRLTERSGEPFAAAQLRGHVWIANFIFTRCPGACPAMTQHMAQLQRDLSKHPRWADIRLVSISVEPEHDTPQRLQAYAARFDADAKHWLFLTGTHQAIWQLCRNGFKQAVELNSSTAAVPIIHSQSFVLVDQVGRIRGYYDSMDPHELDDLRQDVDQLLTQE